MRIIDHDAGAAPILPTRAEPPGGAVEVTPAMAWAALEEWAGFDEARDDLERFLARVYQVMETVRRDATTAVRIPAVTYVDLRYLP